MNVGNGYNASMTVKPTPLIIGIAGGSGSGKTTVAQEILNRVGPEHIAYLPHDAYYKDLSGLPPVQKAEVNFDHPNSLETELLTRHVLQLREGQPIQLPVYDFSNHRRTEETILITPHRVIVVEGILIFAEPDLRFIRRLQRDITERGRTPESVIKQYLKTVRPMHLEFVEPSKRYADVIIPEGGFNTAALDMVAARIQAMLREVH